MALPSRDRFRGLLAGLSADAFVRFVADLWDARGWSVEVDDGAVIARRSEPASERRVMVVRHAAPRLSRPDWTSGRPDATHVVTSGSGSGRAERLARSSDATLLDAEDLYGMALYALDRGAREELFRTHFDRSVDSFEDPATPGASPAVAALSRLASPAPLAAVGIALLVVAAGVIAAPAFHGSGGSTGAGAERTATASILGGTPAGDATPTPTADVARTPSGMERLDAGSYGARSVGAPLGAGESAWPMFRGGPAHRGRNADATEPLGEPIVMATFETGGSVVSSPAVVDGVVYVGSTDGRLYALDAMTLSRRRGKGSRGEAIPGTWTRNFGGSVRSSPAVADGTVYVGGIGSGGYRSGGVPAARETFALSVDTGRTRWRAPTGSISYSSPAVTDDTVYVGGTDGSVYALATTDGARRWRADVGGAVLSSPAVANGTVYVGSNDDRIYALDAESGEVRWTVETGGDVISSPAVVDGTVYVGSMDGSLYAIDAESGEVRFTVETGDSVFSSPAVAYDTVYVGSNDGRVYALDADTGEVRFTVETGDAVFSSPAVVDGVVYVGSMDGHLYALDAETGEVRWRKDLGTSITSSPAVVNGVVYVGTNDGTVYALWARIVPNYPS